MNPIREEKLQELMSFLDNADVGKEIRYLDKLENDIQLIKMQAVDTRDKWIAVMQKLFAYKSELLSLSEIDTLSANINLAVISQCADFIDRHFDSPATPHDVQPEESVEDLFKFLGNCCLEHHPSLGNPLYSISFPGGSAQGNTLMEVLQKAKAELQIKMGFQIKEDLPLDTEDYESDQIDFA